MPPEFLPYVYVSSACYAVVSAVMFGMSQVVISDRESYRMLKYIFISPGKFQAYFVGRGLAKMLEGVAGALITLGFGVLMLPPVRDAIHPTAASLAWLVVYLALGAVLLWSAGMVLASLMLNMSRSGSFLSEGIAGVVYFLSGVVFPLSVLPAWLQAIGMALPTTYWLEGMRRAISGPQELGASFGRSPLAAWSDTDLTLALAASTAGLLVLSQWLYRRNVRIAWNAGRIDEVTGL